MATTKTILAALKLVDAKKENLRKAFEDLQSHSSPLSSFNLTWSDLDSYFTSLQSSLDHKFKILQSQDEQQQQLQQSHPSNSKPQQSQSLLSNPKSTPIPPQSQTPNPPESQTPNPPNPQSLISEGRSESAPARPELKMFCEKMDGLGLRKYIVERLKERNTIRGELPDALRCAPDAAAMVLGAMEGFYVPNSSKGDRDIELSAIRRSCIFLLEKLMSVKVVIEAETREKARNLAEEWKEKVSGDDRDENTLEVLAFLHLIAVYDLADAFDVEELIDLAVEVAKFREAVELFRVLSFGDKMSDLILKLIDKDKQVVAVKLILEFDLSAKFPPVPILEEYVNESKRLAKKALKDEKNSLKSQNEALAKESSAYKSVIKLMEDYNLEHESLKEKLLKSLEIVEKLKSKRKSNAVAPASQTQLQSKTQKLSGSKRPRNTPPARPTSIPMNVAATSSTVPGFQHSHQQPEGLLPKHLPPYLGSPAGPYGLAGSSAVAPYAGSSAAGMYGLTGDPGNLMPSQPREYYLESNMATGYYDRPVPYDGYVLPPQYHQPYYPQ